MQYFKQEEVNGDDKRFLFREKKKRDTYLHIKHLTLNYLL